MHKEITYCVHPKKEKECEQSLARIDWVQINHIPLKMSVLLQRMLNTIETESWGFFDAYFLLFGNIDDSNLRHIIIILIIIDSKSADLATTA